MNAAVAGLHRAGLLTQASLLVDGPAVADAVAIARRQPGLAVGLHLVVADRRPARHGVAVAFLPRCRARMRGSVERQFARFLELGFAPSYWDGHLHLHMHPDVMRCALAAAVAAGFRAVRLVRPADGGGPLAWVFGALARAAKPALDAAGVRYADRVYGLRRTGRMTPAALAGIIGRLPPGIAEVYLHPGVDAAGFDPAPALRAAAAAGIGLADWRHLASRGPL